MKREREGRNGNGARKARKQSEMVTQSGSIPERQVHVAHLRDYLRIVWRHRWTVIAVFLGVVILTGIWSFLQTPIYQATATVEAQTRSRQALSGPDVSGLGATGYGWTAEERFYSTQIEIVRSRELADRVIKRLALQSDPMFAEVDDPEKLLMGMLTVALRKDTGIVEISVQAPDPVRAAELANAYAHEYVQRNLDLGTQAVATIVTEMSRQLEPVRESIQAAEQERFGIAQKEELYVPENQKTIIEENLKTYNEALSKVRIEMAELAGVIQGLEKLERTDGDPLTIKRIADDEELKSLVSQRTGLQQELEKLKVKFRSGAPEYRETESKLDTVKGRITDRMRSLADSFRIQYNLLAGQASGLQGRIDEGRKESFAVGQKTSQYQMAKTDVETRQRVYDSLLQSVNQIALQASLLDNNLTMLDEAVPPNGRISPKIKLNLLMGGMIGMMLGIGLAFFLDYLDNTIKSTDDIENMLQLHLLSVIPRYRESTGHAVREAYQTLRTSVLFSSRGRQAKTLLVTSAGPREGKTSTIVNLARTIANAGERVALVDCDLRRPRVHEDLSIQREPGATNYLAGLDGDDYRDFMSPTNVPTLMAMPCGPIPPNPPELFGTQRFRELLDSLRKDFDWVLIDSPPVASVTDAVILSSMTDMVAFVVKHNENDRELIRRAVASVRKVNPNIIGAVLNNVDIEKGGSDYYYTGYYYAEGDGEGRRKKKSRSRTDGEKIGAAR